MKKWEYNTLSLEFKRNWWGKSDFPTQEINSTCNKLGLEGWELVNIQTNSVYQGQSTHLLLIFKREIN